MGSQLRILRYLRPYLFPFLLALGLLFLITACEILKPWPLKVIVDYTLAGKSLPWPAVSNWTPRLVLFVACLGLVLIYGALAFFHWVNSYLTITIGQSMVNDFRSDLYRHTQRLSLAFHSRQRIGDLLYRLASDTYAIQTIIMRGLYPLLTAVILLAGMFMVMSRMDFRLTLVSLSVCPVLFLSIALLSRRLTQVANRARQRESDFYSHVQQSVAAIRVIQAFSQEEEEHERFMSASDQSLAANLKLYTWQTFYNGVVSILIALGTALVIWFGASYVLSNRITIGDLLVFTSYLASLYLPINTITSTYGVIQEARAGARRVFEILDIEHDLKDGRREFPSEGVRGKVEFRNVSFSYRGGEPVLRNIHLAVSPGEIIAVVGSTGAGKSTLLGMIPRFHDPVDGQVLVDGTDIREFRIASLRRQIAMVLQPPVVFSGSVRENIAYGNPEATLDEIIHAARAAHIHDVVMNLSKGYDTVIAEQGATVSEGEKQRITIARAILLNAPILILDEPTSAIDTKTEASIMEELMQWASGRTVFIIAHRLTTLRKVSKIIFLQNREIAEEGSFDELVGKKDGLFAAFFQAHFTRHDSEHAVLPDLKMEDE